MTRRSWRIWIPVFLVVAFPAGFFLGSRVDAGSAEPAPSGVDLANRSARPETSILRTAGPADPIDAPTAANRQESPESRRFTPIVDAARRVAPSVVSISILRVSQSGPRSLFEDFFGRTQPRSRLRRSYGSGFAIDHTGLLITNEHVVRGADSIVVTDSQGRVHPAAVVGADELTDIAVLRIEEDRVPPAPLGTSSDLMVGEPAIAIGNPFGYLLANAEATVTAGVISGVGRDIRSADERQTLLADMVQTDASINPGNSGGPLVNADGQVIGVNSSIFSRSGGSEGLGFAIPIDRALRIVGELRDFGRIRRPFVGVDPMAVESDTLLFSETLIRRVAPGSSAAGAGLEPGDILVAIDGRPVASPLDWEVGLLDAGVGSEIEVAYRRDGSEREARLLIEELPSESAERLQVLAGLELITLDPQIAVERRLEVEAGAMITRISQRNAAYTGMRDGDVIVEINRRPVASAEDVADLFQYYSGRSSIRVSVYRSGKIYITTFYVQ
ncbi:MAG: trypsin-like peptidase domain-containing protein [Gemmatimonadetes bacterium]|nr:trypsin-like peptidase domain-containing protein [Gemmatimonadota bacterium]